MFEVEAGAEAAGVGLLVVPKVKEGFGAGVPDADGVDPLAFGVSETEALGAFSVD